MLDIEAEMERLLKKYPDPRKGRAEGARYLDSKTSRWLSGDPAMADYIPSASVNDEARRRNGNLPGMGGVFNVVNLHVYHYLGNNPVKYTDPDGKWLALKARLDRVNSDIVNLINRENMNPFIAKDQAYQKVKNEVNTGSFSVDAIKFARRELNKTEEQINTWAENEQTRLGALLAIRDESESTYENILNEVAYEYRRVYERPAFDDRGRRIYSEQTKKDIADKAANRKLDELIRNRLPSHEVQND
jgi:hypothetical protein